MQCAVRLTPDGHRSMPVLLNGLMNLLQDSFKHTGDLSDVSEAILIQQRAVQLAGEAHTAICQWLNELGNLFLERLRYTGNLSDVHEAILVQQRGIRLTPNGHETRPGMLYNLGVSYLRRFEHTGDLSDILEAISVKQRAVQLTPNDHEDLPLWLNGLGISLQRRFEYTGDLSDISEAITAQQRAVQLTPNGHARMPSRLNGLGNSFLRRFERTGDLSDLSEANVVLQRAVQLTPNGDADMPLRLNSLGVSFLHLFKHTGDPSDISEAISTLHRAVQLTPSGHADLPLRLNNLGNSFQYRFERMRALSDLSEAITFQQRAVQLTPNGHTDMPSWLNNLGNSFLYRFERTRDLSDITEAISAQQRALQLTPESHAQLPLQLNNLGNSFQSRFRHTGDSSDSYTAVGLYKRSATTLGRPSIRLNAARQWAQLSAMLNRQDIMEAYTVAIDLISQIAGMYRTVEQRHADLIHISSLTIAAASAAFALGKIEKALEWLEQGRCLVWSQLNQLRTPVDELRAHHADLAERFLEISSALESSGSRRGFDTQSTDTPMSEKMALQHEAHTHLKLAQEWSRLLDEIRCIPTFHDFLRPPQTSGLLNRLPPDGPVILINVQESRCDALALISGLDKPIHIPLPEFTHEQASKLRERLRSFLLSQGIRMRGEDRGRRPVRLGRRRDSETQSDIHFVLEAIWLGVVKPILSGLSYSVSLSLFMIACVSNSSSCKSPPVKKIRIWWCPTGPLAFLPLHAAGIYRRNGAPSPGSCILDYAISSYTPTVSALLEKVKVPTDGRPVSLSKLLIISQPNTPGCAPIPSTTEEMTAIWNMVGSDHSESLRLEAEAATVSRVMLEMKSHNSIHFACHASQDVKNPLRSGLYLHDGRLQLAEIMKLKIPHCELAFLSACQTSTGDEKLCEEAVHLAAGMLAVGYRGVIATMWSVQDEFGPVVAESFYKYVMENGATSGRPGIDSTSAACALHQTIQDVRKRVGDTEQGLLTWVPYVHFGY